MCREKREREKILDRYIDIYIIDENRRERNVYICIYKFVYVCVIIMTMKSTQIQRKKKKNQENK